MIAKYVSDMVSRYNQYYKIEMMKYDSQFSMPTNTDFNQFSDIVDI